VLKSLVASCLLLAAFVSPAVADERLRRVRAEIERLEGELRALEQRETGLLGRIERLGVEVRLREAELQEVSLRHDAVSEALAGGEARLSELVDAQAERRDYLAFRLREIYKSGPERTLREWVGDDQTADYWSGLRYASVLSERDARTIVAYRADAERIREENTELRATEARLEGVLVDLERARRRQESTRERHTRALQEVREDRRKREAALVELNEAASQLSVLVGSLVGPSSDAAPRLDVRKFRGLLDWPSEGSVSAGFGTIVHPRFKTRVPHPGLDIDGEFGAPIRSIFEGRVVFASWMRGYGLTVILDHGSGLLSIYAHASVILAEKGEFVQQGQRLGTIGDTGSLRGPFLYFELREDGKPVDPSEWLRPR